MFCYLSIFLPLHATIHSSLSALGQTVLRSSVFDLRSDSFKNAYNWLGKIVLLFPLPLSHWHSDQTLSHQYLPRRK
jgi:hypothetical protein